MTPHAAHPTVPHTAPSRPQAPSRPPRGGANRSSGGQAETQVPPRGDLEGAAHFPLPHLLLLIFLLSTAASWGQTTYSARVVDAETGEALPLVGVYLSEERNTLTNFDGEFSIEADSADMLHLTCVGRESVSLRAGELPTEVRMRMLSSTLAEVTVQAVERMLLQVARRMEKAFDRKKLRQAQYFYRQTSVLAMKQDIVEAFIRARSAVNLRELEFLTGRHGRLSQAAWAKSAVNDMNLHHLLEIGPMTRDAHFWSHLIAPLPTARQKSRIDYLQHYYIITCERMDGDAQQLYRITLRRNPETEVSRPIMTGALYVDRTTLNPLAFDGQVENLQIRFGQGELRSATVVPVTFNFHVDYRHDHKYPEVADLSMQTEWGDFQTRTMLFNVESQRRLTRSQKKRIARAQDNMLSSIQQAGYDSTFWASNEVIKRTAQEQAIATGTIERQQARLDSIAAAQAALPPLQRLADRLARFGQAIPQEKVYVHMDNTSYFLGDTIWFAAYTRRTNEDRPSRISRVLYCELWNHDGYLVERKLVEMQDGRGHGFFALPDTLYSGYFELRAYTRWQLNWGQTEHYHAWSTEYWFYNKAMAKDFFRDYEKLYSRVFPVYDKPKEPGEYYRDMTFRPLRRYFRTEEKAPELRLSLFPEGGNLVAGVPCRVAFEAATSEGEVREGELRLLRGRDVITTARTENRGRGTFTFTPEEGEDYEAVFAPIPNPSRRDEGSVTQQIKAVRAEGVSLQVHRDSLTGSWRFDIAARGQAARQPLGVTVMSEGRLQAFHESPFPTSPRGGEQILWQADMQGGSVGGVYQVTVFDSIGHIYADRLFFVTPPDLARPTLTISGAREQYQPFEQIEFDITSANPAPGQTISLAVRDAVLSDNTFDSGNILTEMLLASEIKGFVPQPEYFFERDDEEHRRALDLLMLTQGWRRFNWQDMAVRGSFELTHPAEHTQMVTGTVNRYWSDVGYGEDLFNQVDADHERFMTEQSTPLSVQQSRTLFEADGRPTALSVLQQGLGRQNMAWNLSPIYQNRADIGAISDTRHGIFAAQGHDWTNTDYNVLNFQTGQTYRLHQKRQHQLAARRYLETGTVKKEVRVHAEFINPADQRDYLVGETETTRGRFRIDLPRFEGDCVFFLGASDTTRWHRKWEGLRRRKPHTWTQMDQTNEYDKMAGRIADHDEFYIRLNYPYPRWVKPYTFYQVHNAPLPTPNSPLRTPDLQTDSTHLLDQITVRTRHGGLRRIDYSKPAYVIDAYEAYNLAMDAGLITPSSSSYSAAAGVAAALIADMGMHRHYTLRVQEDSRPGLWRGPLEQMRWGLLTFMDKFYIYTDYSPRREGDRRFDQDNQPQVIVDMRRLPEGGMRVTYRDRRYILPGFAPQQDFYHPDYHRRTPDSPLPTHDHRRTLYWNPAVQLDADGRARIRLYNNGRQSTIAIDAAGQSAEGALLFN